jgi:hypothetical protein
MKIKPLHILPTDNTPEFFFDPQGTIRIKGRGLYGTGGHPTEEIQSWVESYLKEPAENTLIKIAFEYLNSYSTSILVKILKNLSGVQLMKKKLTIHWFYEEDDDDILERGEYVASAFNIPIRFSVTNDINTCC